MPTFEERTNGEGKKKFRVRVRLKGYPAQSATFDRVTDARRWAAKIETDLREGRYFRYSEAKRHTVAEMIDRYTADVLPAKNTRFQEERTYQLRYWKEKIGSYTLADATPPVISEARDEFALTPTNGDRKRSPGSVNRYLAALSAVFTRATKEWMWMEESPMRKVSKPSEPRGRVRFLSDDERSRLLKACLESDEPLLHPFVVVALSTGTRRGELLSLRWPDVDFHAGQIRLLETKNDERRAVPLTGLALDLVTGMASVRRIDTDLVFPFKGGKQGLRAPWEKALKKAEIEDFRFHDLRHSAASYLAMNGATLAEIAEILGHKTLQMVKRYSHLTKQHTSRVVAAMNKKIFAE